MYGKELIIDLHDCNTATFTRDSIEQYFGNLCDLIDMEACDLHFWDDEGVPKEQCQTNPKTKGISAIQFIITSNITIHALDLLKAVYINVFSCKDFDDDTVRKLTVKWFGGKIVRCTRIIRE